MSLIRSIIFGAPGSGKGTISERICQRFRFTHVSSGDILRANIVAGTELGITVNSFVSTGKLVPDDVMNALIESKLNECSGSWLLDGYPRTLSQTEKLWEHVQVNLVINLEVPFDVIIDRLKNRWIHESSGRIYNVGFSDPKVPGLDDITREKLIQREDDKPAVVLKRLETYAATSRPIIEFFRSKGVLETFEGKSSNEIWEMLYPFLRAKLGQ